MIYPEMLVNNRYRVIRQMSEGGFGKTFEVDDNGTQKVLKVLHTNYHKAVSLFEREANVLIQLHHPGIPRVDPDGYFQFLPDDNAKPLYCLVMEKIEGHNLQEWISNNSNQTIKQEQAINWLKQLVEILDIIHQQQYFHRDIKPENIMLKPDGHLVLIDFGAVRQITDTYLGKIGGRQEGTRVGTSGYMPIEQVDGVALPQSDFFALGRTFVYLLTSKHPWDLMNYQSGGLIWRDSATQISPEFADLIDWMMAPFPGKRPANTQVILQSLDGIGKGLLLAGQMLEQGQDVHPTKSQNVDPTKLKSITVKVGLAASVLFGMIGSFRLASPQIASFLHQNGYNDYMAKNYKSAEFNFNLAIALNPEDITGRYSHGASCQKLKQYECAKSEYEIAKFAEDDATAASAINNLGYLYILNEQKYDEAIKLLSQGLKRANQIAVMSDIHKNIGWAYFHKNQLISAAENLLRAIEIDDKNAPAYCLLAQVREAQKDNKAALANWDKCRQYGDKDNPEEANSIALAQQRLLAKSN